ncbi:UDP-N-acetylmuramoyl-L-alanine--D-glutamate ligase, partial [Mesorhizobium sp. M7D.F.Ca.US.004.01.2.1]
MIPAASFSGKHVSLFGLGGSGIATARALIEGGADVLAWDDNPDSVAKA